MAEGSSNFGDAKNIRLAAGWAFFQRHESPIVIPLGYTQDGIQTEISSESEGIEVDQSPTPVITTLSGITVSVTTPLVEWKIENMQLAFPGAQIRTTASGHKYLAMTSNVETITGTLRIHPTDMPDNDHTKDTFYPNVSPQPNISYTIDGTAAQQLPIEWQASPGLTPYAEVDGDTAYFDHMPEANIVHVEDVEITPATLNLAVGASAVLTAEVVPIYATDKALIWTSSNESVATVSQYGVVTAVAAGSATITATSRDGAISDTRSVTVS
jgi:uncharacterized protein YjdB